MAAGAVLAPRIIPIIHLCTQRTKNHIDTNTPVSIHSDSSGVLIFYTLDGSKPGAGQRGAVGSSRKYSDPILLRAGQVTIRAVAVTSDGRESSVVTKVFSVDPVDDVPQDLQQCPSEGTSRPAEASAGSSPKPAGPRFLNSRLGSRTVAAHLSASHRSQPVVCQGSGNLRQLDSMQAPRMQQGTLFLRCVCCLNPRPPDPFARFCSQCGAPVPPLPSPRPAPADGEEMKMCMCCGSLVPINVRTCLTCEITIAQRRRQAAATLQMGGVRNGAPSFPATHGRKVLCARCKRLNRSDARFCDWCSSKRGDPISCGTCWRCGAKGHPHAFYCTICGAFLEAPAPPTSCCDISQPSGGAATSRASAQTSSDSAPQATPSSHQACSMRAAPPTVDQCTQTVGLYYPSATELQKEQQSALQLLKQQALSGHRPPLTAVSPGRGYWRKQVDHVCAHLLSYVQNNAPLRAMLGEPRLGRIVSATFREDQREVSLTVSFVVVGRNDRQVGPAEGDINPAGGRSEVTSQMETLSGVMERTADSSSSLRSDQFSDHLKSSQPNPTPKPPALGSHQSSSAVGSSPMFKNLQLLNELGRGRGQISVVQELLDQGADPSCCRGDGLHALAVAVVNGHHEVLPVLVQRGADVDQQSRRMKNTALHEAAALGSAGLQCAEVLLKFKASVKLRNAAGQTPYNVAMSSGCSSMASLLAAQTGLDLLGKLRKSKSNLDVF